MTEPPPPPAPSDPPARPNAKPPGTAPGTVSDATSGRTAVSRRRILRGAAAAPLAALPACAAPEPDRRPTVAALERLNALGAHPVAAARLATILPAARLNHAFFRPVRAVELPDDLEPAVRFHAAGPSSGNRPEEA